MISTHRDSFTGETRLLVRQGFAEAWISPCPRLHSDQSDWVLWFMRSSQPSLAKCQLPLEIESRLRAWLLRRFRRRLRDLHFEQLCALAESAEKRPVPERQVSMR
jgi:hypothetical protein